MKILILSCKTGEGHNSAAKAMEEAFKRLGAECEIKDPVSFGGDKAKKAVSSLYNGIIKKTPKVFGAIYKIGEFYDRTELPSPVYYANSLYAKNLDEYIRNNNIDAVVCTHLYGMEAMTAIKKKFGCPVPCYGIFTDYTCIPFIGDVKMTAMFVPHDEIKQEYIYMGYREDKVFSYGIPVSNSFNEDISREDAREELGIDSDKKMILIMTGGVGCGKIYELCEELKEVCKEENMIYVMTGHNNDMKEEIDEKYRGTDNIRTVSFTHKVNLYIKSSDVLITKPGGLSSTEAAVAKVPMVQFMTIPGCETKNADFFRKHEMALKADSIKEAAYCAKILLCDKDTSERMKAMQKECINENAADDIAKKIIAYER